jgi:glycosyltransferase involved in cell wall biosynthesis
MKLSVIVPCLNAAETIGCQLEALANQRWSEPWEVVVVDNGSTDESMAITRQYRQDLPNLRIVEAPKRRSRPYARNVGVMAATGDAIAFCDADDEVAPGWVAAMGKALSEQYDFVACRIDTKKLNPPWMHGTRVNNQDEKLPKVWYPPFLPFAGAGTLGVKRKVHDAVGGFDESLPVVEDVDYCFRAQRAGVTLHLIRDAVVHVRYRQSSRGIYRQARLWGEYNVLMYKRYRSRGPKEFYRWKSHIRGWLEILYGLPELRTIQGQMNWRKRLGWQLGILMGSIKYMVPPVPIP